MIKRPSFTKGDEEKLEARIKLIKLIMDNFFALRLMVSGASL